MKTVLDVATELANAHKKEDPCTQAVYLADSDREVRLVEVSSAVEGPGDVLPFRFAARDDLGVPYESVIVLLSVDDWTRLSDGRLSLPDGWGEPKALKKIA